MPWLAHLFAMYLAIARDSGKENKRVRMTAGWQGLKKIETGDVAYRVHIVNASKSFSNSYIVRDIGYSGHEPGG